MKKEIQKEKELQKEFWKIGKTIFWSMIAVILFTIFLDVIILSKNWLDFVLLKLFLLGFFYFTYNFFTQRYKTPNLLIHLTLFSFNFLTLVSISDSGTENRMVYTSLLIALFVAFNTFAIWSIINSFIQYLLVIVTFLVLVYMGEITDPYQILNNGGYLFLLLGFMSFFFPKVRKSMIIERIGVQLRADEKIKYLGGELSEVQTSYKSLQNKVIKKENEAKFLFQQISNDLNKINEVVTEIEGDTTEEKKRKIQKLDDLIQNLRNQSSVYFRPINLETNKKNYSTDKVDVLKVYQNVIKSFTSQIEGKHINFIEQLIAVNPQIIGNKKIFNTILYNILNFMVIFSDENDDIVVTIDTNTKDTIFSVANKTSGINTSEIESYFRDLEFVNYDYKKHSDSVKIGLRISKQLTEKMNGYFSYVSSENMGFELKIQFKTFKQN
ncbi:sensor histidine kinase [Formosa sp. 4Alg 33]|uniref:sensor histidine kinase n=1 Tax=Formosa sp. 4Alg 33 TaxID=3382189 RepID=UPI003D9C3383